MTLTRVEYTHCTGITNGVHLTHRSTLDPQVRINLNSFLVYLVRPENPHPRARQYQTRRLSQSPALTASSRHVPRKDSSLYLYSTVQTRSVSRAPRIYRLALSWNTPPYPDAQPPHVHLSRDSGHRARIYLQQISRSPPNTAVGLTRERKYGLRR